MFTAPSKILLEGGSTKLSHSGLIETNLALWSFIEFMKFMVSDPTARSYMLDEGLLLTK